MRPGEAVDDRAMTLEEIGRELGVTRERARQIEAKALGKLRAECERLGIEPGDVVDSWRRMPATSGIDHGGRSGNSRVASYRRDR